MTDWIPDQNQNEWVPDAPVKEEQKPQKYGLGGTQWKARQAPGMLDQKDPLPYDFNQGIADNAESHGLSVDEARKGFAASLYDYTVGPWAQFGDTAAASLNRGVAVFATHLDMISDYIGEKTGTQAGGIFERAAKTYNDNAEYWQKRADEAGNAFIPELLGEAVGGALPGIDEFLLNIPYAALLGAADDEKQKKTGRGEFTNAMIEAGKRGVLGLVFHQVGQFKKYLSAPVMGGIFGTQTAFEGGDAREIAKGVGTGVLYGLSSPGGRMGLNEVRKNFEKEIVKRKAEEPPEITPKGEDNAQQKEVQTKGEVNIANSVRGDIVQGMTSRKGTGDIPPKTTQQPEGGEPKWYSFGSEKRKEYFDPDSIRNSGNYQIWDHDEGKWWTFRDETHEQSFREKYPLAFLTEEPAGVEKTWYRFGKPPQGNRSINFADNKGEAGVSVYATPEGNNPFFTDRDVYSGPGRQIGWGSDGEPLVIPTGEWKKVNPNPSRPQEVGGQSIPFAPKADFRRSPEGQEPTDTITKRSDLVRFLNEKLDVPIRTGRFHDKALGIFKIRDEVIRTEKANDIEVISHEIGHALQKFLYPETVGTSGLKSQPFSAYKNELDPMATTPKAGQDVTPEGFAEFVRLYITNRPLAKEKAPNFYDHFEHSLTEKSPETLDIFNEASRQYERWLRQPELQRVLSQVSVGQKDKREVSWDKVYTMSVDELYPLKQIVDDMAPQKLKAGEDPYKLARLIRGVDGKVQAFLEHSPFKFKTYEDVGKPLKEILDPLKKNLDEFRAYIVSRRTLDLEKRGIETGVLPADAKTVVDKYHEQFNRSFEDLKEFQDHALQYLKDSGMIDQKTYDKIKLLNEDYVPLYRIMDNEKKGGIGSGLQARSQIKKIKGSWRDIQDPLESIIKNTHLYINAAEKNAVGQALVNLAEKTGGMGKYVEEIPTPIHGTKGQYKEIFTKDELAQMEEIGIDPDASFTIFRAAAFVPRDDVVSVWKDGKQKLYQVDKEIGKVFHALDKESTNALMKILSTPASWLRAGATMTPEFIARNPLRDQFSSFIYSKYGFVPGYDLAKGIFSLAKKDQAYWDWKKGGGDHSMLVSMDRDYLQDNLGELLQKYPVMNRIKNPIECLRILSELGEAGTRIGEFKKGIKKEGTTKEGIQEAALAAREVTLDFNRKGTIGKSVNMITAFWNAQMQGMDKMGREFKDNPVVTSLKTAAAITLPSVLLAIATHDDPRVKEVPAWQRDLFWIIPTDNAVYRIPKPFELGVLFGSIPERITHYIMDQDPHTFDGLLDSVVSGATPGFVPTAAIPFMENWANKSLFYGSPIVPQSRTELLPEYQYSQHTSETAKELSKVLGRLPWVNDLTAVSPAKVENMVRGWTGGLGIYALQIADKSLEASGITEQGYERPTSTLSDIPFIKAFTVRYPSSNAASVQRFYDNYNEANQVLQTVKQLMTKENEPEEAIRLMESSNMETLTGHYEAIRNIHKLIDAIYINPTMTGDEKREYIDTLYMQMIDIARNGNEVFDMIKEKGGLTR